VTNVDSTTFPGPSIAPGSSGIIQLKLPADWPKHDALRLTATDPHGREIYTWWWPLRSPADFNKRIVGSGTSGPAIQAGASGSQIVVTNGGRVFRFDATNGHLSGATVSGQTISLSNGPRPVTGSWTVSNVTHGFQGLDYVITVNDLAAAANGFRWRIRPDGWLRLNYRYTLTGTQSWIGVTFDYPENDVTAMRWLGQGPYRVWKNRLAGQEVGVHFKESNNTDTGKQ
jgi:hypothetical protein